ncbi:MAG: DNA repair protein RecN [Eubacteriales bacterium]
MLLSLHIENVALIARLDIDFSKGFTVLTGETGAGKSILIDSIGLLLGEKADKSLIRHGEQEAFVSGLFGGFSPPVLAHLAELDITPDEDGCLLVSRRLSEDGKSRIKVSGVPATAATLKEAAKYLIGIVGQTDQLQLRDPVAYRRLLDGYAKNQELLQAYQQLYKSYTKVSAELRQTTESESDRIRMTDMLSYQIKDIDALSLRAGEDVALAAKEKRLRNSERLARQTDFVWRALKGAEKASAAYTIDRSIAALVSLTDVVEEAPDMVETLRDCLYRIEDIAERVSKYTEDIEEDPTEAIDRIQARLAAIEKLKRKYGETVADILAFRTRAAEQLEQLRHADERIGELTARKQALETELSAAAERLHESRQRAARALSAAVVDTLRYLDMENVRLLITVTPLSENGQSKFSEHGCDAVECLISANKGEELRPLSKIASGGELSRILLALKHVTAAADDTPTLIFDEIDTGISGKTTRKVGLKLLDLSRSVQLLCVTHSAQVASLADTHLLISKQEQGQRTHTTLTELTEQGRVDELSRIIGGIHVTDAQRAAALEMLADRRV